jgi:hypothetical protein
MAQDESSIPNPNIRPWLPTTGRSLMAKPTNVRYQTLSKALAIIDPKGVLLPGTTEHNRFTEMILSWMDEMEPDEVLRMSHDNRSFLNIEGHSWLRNWKE